MTARRLLQLSAGIAGCAALAIGGVFLGRALADSSVTARSEPPALTAPSDGAGVAAAARAVDPAVEGDTARVLPVLEPVRVGGGDDVGRLLLEAPEPEPGVPQAQDASDHAPAIAGAVPVSGPADRTESTPIDFGIFSLESFDWPWLFGVIRIDPCAGASPGERTPEGCPEGGAATFSGTYREPPAPFAFFAAGHYTTEVVPERRTCAADTPAPAAGEAAMTLFTRTPIEEVSLRYRPYGSTEAWTELRAVRSPDDHTTWWREQLETRPYDDEWATLPICFVTAQHESMAYEVEANGTDVFGQAVRSNGVGIVSPVTLGRRPPATARIVGRSSTGIVQAHSLDAGMVQFRTRTVDPSEDDPTCERATLVPPEDVLVVENDRVIPIGVYDPAYTRKHELHVPIPPGGRVVVCAEVYPDDNPLTPLATDRLLLVAPTQQRPRIVLQGIRRLGDSTVPEGVTIRAGATDAEGRSDQCGRWYRTPEIPPGAPLSVEQTLYECVHHPLPVDSMGRGQIPVTVTRAVGSTPAETMVEEVAIPIVLDDCSATACDRPREWYELPIPTGDRRLCGSGFGSSTCDAPEPDGIAVLRVEYPVIEAGTGRYGEVLLLDQVDAATAAGNVRTAGWDATFEPSGDELHPLARVRFFTDRPVQVLLRAIPYDDDGCSTVEEVATGGYESSFEVVFTAQCAGSAFQIEGTATEPDGTVHTIDRGWAYFSSPLKNVAHVQVELLGGDGVPELGHIYRFGVELDGQTPTAYWFDWSASSRGTSDACMGLAGSTARTRGFPPEIYLTGAELDVHVRIHITTTGSGDCSGDGRTGLGEIELTGSFTFEQLQSGEPLVLESGPDSPLRMRLTMTTERDRWRP